MRIHDWLIILAFTFFCILLYLAIFSLPRCNRREKRFTPIWIGGTVSLMISLTAWFLFFEIFARNYGLGGTYLRLSILPILLLFNGILLTAINYRKGESI